MKRRIALPSLVWALALILGQYASAQHHLVATKAGRVKSAAPPQFDFQYVGEVVDAASYTSGIAPGSLFAIVHGSFPVSGGLTMSPLPLQQSLNGISIIFTPAGGGEAIKAWMFYTYAAAPQLAAVLPSTARPGNYTVSVVSGSETVTGGKARVVAHHYRSFTNNQAGDGLAVIQNYVSASRVDRNMFVAGSLRDGQTKSPANPGQTMILWGLGLGAIPGPDNEAPGAVDLRGQLDVKVAVGGIDAPVLYAGRAPQFPGIDQINFTVPGNAPTGCNVALQVTVNGEASNPVTIAVAPPGKNACEHSLLTREQLETLDQAGRFLAGEFNVMQYVEPYSMSRLDSFVEIHSSIGFFGDMTASRAGQLSSGSVAPGRCTLVRGEDIFLLDAGANDSYDGGVLTVSGPSLPDVPLDGDDDWYYRLFSVRDAASGARLSGNASHLLMPGTHTLRGAGGANAGPFDARLELPELLRWTNRDAILEVNRDSGVTLNWTGGGSSGQVIIQGFAASSSNGGQDVDNVTFMCAALPGSTSFTVPPEVFRSVPSTTDPLQSMAFLVLAAFSGNSSARFDAPLTQGGKLAPGIFGSLLWSSKFLPYR